LCVHGEKGASTCRPLKVVVYPVAAGINILCYSIGYNSTHERIKMSVSKVSEQDYEKMQYDVYALQKAGEYMSVYCREIKQPTNGGV